jgi:hypothetical protein
MEIENVGNNLSLAIKKKRWERKLKRIKMK